MKRIVWLALLAVLALSTTARAQEADFSQTVELTPTKYGVTLGAAGKVSIEVMAERLEIFTLSAMAEIPNRTQLTVQISRPDGYFEIGGLRMLLGMGTFEQWSSISPSPVFPVTMLKQVIVYQGKEAILEGSF